MKVQKLQERLKQRDLKINSLLDLTKAINANLSTEELLDRYRNVMQNQLLIERLVLIIHAQDKCELVIKYGTETDFSNLDIEKVLKPYRDIKFLQADESVLGREFGLIIPVYHENRPLAYVLIGDIEDDELKMSPLIKHMRFIQTLTNVISVAIENKSLMKRALEQERYRTELNLAAEMQELLIGTGRRNYPGVEVAGYYKPHIQVGGDFFDYIRLSESESFLCVADVSGKGISAAFLMATIHAHLKALLQLTNWTLESLVKELNKKVVETVKGERFVTMFIAYFHHPTRVLHYINAGHNPPLVYSKNTITALEDGTVGIGMLDRLPFINKNELKLGKDAIIACFTDGIVEMENENKEEYGTERMGKVMEENAKHIDHVDDIITHILHSVDIHRGANPYFDDTSLLCCRFK